MHLGVSHRRGISLRDFPYNGFTYYKENPGEVNEVWVNEKWDDEVEKARREDDYFVEEGTDLFKAIFEWVAKVHPDWTTPMYSEEYVEFPGTILVSGYIAQGDAGRMGGGSQPIAVMPYCTWFQTKYGGRLYGNPNAHYYYHDGENLMCFTEKTKDLFLDQQ